MQYLLTFPKSYNKTVLMKIRLLATRLLSLCVILISPLLLLAQQKTITGKVTNEVTGAALAGVSITAKGTRNATQTGADGTFTLSVPQSVTTLTLSSVGFGSKDVTLDGSNSLTATLTETGGALNEVVVIGYGTASRKTVTGAIASLKAKDFNQGVIAAPDQLLQSKVAGLEVTNTSGQPGAATTIQIRGNSSIRSGNNPLYVVDGVPLDGASARPNLGIALGGSNPNSNPLLFIDPYSIAQIDVLKDASSAAIYGSRGANGVIVVTTKKASTGPMRVDVGVSMGFNAGFMKRFEVLNVDQFRTAIKKYRLDTLSTSLDGKANTDALKEISQAGFTQNYSVAFGGGNEVGRFRAGFLASRTEGLIKKSSLDKYLATLGGNYKFIDNKLTLDFSLIAGNYGEQLTSVSNNAGSEGNIISSALSFNPTLPIRDSKGLYVYPGNGSGNPLAYNDAFNDRSSVNSILGSISASYKIAKNLEYKFLYGVNHSSGIRKASLDGWIKGVAAVSGAGVAGKADADLTSMDFTHTLSYKTPITKDLSLDAVAGYEYFKSDFSGGSNFYKGFAINLTENARTGILYTDILQNANTVTSSSFSNPTTEIQSFFGRATFNYMDNLIVTGSLRADGSSKFGSNNRYGIFPAVGARWITSNASFMKDQKLFSNLAIRGSFGITGNQEFPAGAGQEQFAYSTFSTYGQSTNGNPDLKWESTRSFNIGADFSFLRGKLFSSIDYYYKNTKDLLFQGIAIAPASSAAQFRNLPSGNLINSGFEAVVGYTFADRKNFGLEASMNVSYNKNELKNFKDKLTGLDILIQTATISGQGVSGTLAQVITNNQPLNVYYLKNFEGFDANGNQQIGVKDPLPHFAGDPNPKWLGGLSTSLRYNKFNLNLNFGGSFDFLIYNNSATAITNIAGIANGRNIDLAAYNSPERLSSGVGASTRFLEKGDYVKLRNATIRYTLGNRGKYLKNVSAYVSGTNLFVITKFTGFDPEVNIDKTSNNYPSRSIEYVPYPTPRVVTFGLNFSL